MSLEEYLALVEQDVEHAYEDLDGRVYMMTGSSPDHSIIGSNLNGLLQAFLRGRRCIVSTLDVYVQLSEQYRLRPDVTVSCDPLSLSGGRRLLSHHRSERSRPEVLAVSRLSKHSRIPADQF
jgi:Uma2 family endonuclease